MIIMKLEIKKINKKVELDTKVEGCWSDCWDGTYIWKGYSAEVAGEFENCKKEKKMTAETCWFW